MVLRSAIQAEVIVDIALVLITVQFTISAQFVGEVNTWSGWRSQFNNGR